jgi:hypothetical protein
MLKMYLILEKEEHLFQVCGFIRTSVWSYSMSYYVLRCARYIDILATQIFYIRCVCIFCIDINEPYQSFCYSGTMSKLVFLIIVY